MLESLWRNKNALLKMKPSIFFPYFSGETDGNAKGIVQGKGGGNFGLNEEGRKQAAKAGQWIGKEGLHKFTRVYCSDLQRFLVKFWIHSLIFEAIFNSLIFEAIFNSLIFEAIFK